MIINSANETGSELTSQQRRICLHNIAACKAHRENPPPPPVYRAPKQRDYKPEPLAAPVGTLALPQRTRKLGWSEKRTAEAAHVLEVMETLTREPVRVVAVAPYPNSESTNSK